MFRSLLAILTAVFSAMAVAASHAAYTGEAKDPFGLKCTWLFKLIGADGTVKERRKLNMIVDVGFDAILMSLFETTLPSRPTPFGFIAIGGGNTAPAANQTGLISEFTNAPAYGVYQRQAISKTFTPGSKTITLSATFGPNIGIGNVVEAGMFNALSAGTMLNRVLIGAFNKTITDTLIVEVQVDVQ